MSRFSCWKFRQFDAWNIHTVVSLLICTSLLLLFYLSFCCQWCYWLLSFLFHFNSIREFAYWFFLAIFNVVKSSLSFFLFNTHSQSMSSVGYRALCIEIKFLIFWSICLSSSLVYFNNSPEYLIRGTAQVFTPLIRFLLQSLVYRGFSFVWGILLLFLFFHLRLFGVYFQYSQVFVILPFFSKRSDSFFI